MIVVNGSLAAGAEDFFLKRTAASDLIPAAEEILRGGRYVSPFTPQ